MKYIRIFFGENVYSNAQWIFYFYVKDEMNHDISSQITQIHQQKDEKEYSDTSPPPPPPPPPPFPPAPFLLMEGNDLEKNSACGNKRLPYL